MTKNEELPMLKLSDEICEQVKGELKAYGEALIKQLDKQEQAGPVGYKKNVREVVLPQRIAHSACSGLLNEIEDCYIGNWKRGEVLLIYAEEDTPETMEKLENDHELYARFYNALMFGNLPMTVTINAYIGFIKLGTKTIKRNHKRYVEITGAELMDEPFDEMPEDVALCKTHVAEYRNIKLEDGIIKIPLSEMGWEELKSENFLSFYWEKKFDGLIFFPEKYNYLFYAKDEQKCVTSIKHMDDYGNEEAENAIYRGTNKDRIAFLCFDLSKMEEKQLRRG